MDKQASRSRDILACLGDASRFRLVLSLLERERCVTELARRVGLSQSCTTRHLQYLEREGVVRGLRQGKRVMFHLRADRPRVRELLAWVVGARAELEDPALSGADLHTDGPVGEAGGQSPPRPAGRSRRARIQEPPPKPRDGRARARVSPAALRGAAGRPADAAPAAAGAGHSGPPAGADEPAHAPFPPAQNQAPPTQVQAPPTQDKATPTQDQAGVVPDEGFEGFPAAHGGRDGPPRRAELEDWLL